MFCLLKIKFLRCSVRMRVSLWQICFRKKIRSVSVMLRITGNEIYLSFSVLIDSSDNAIAIIQNLMITLDSGQPLSSK